MQPEKKIYGAFNVFLNNLMAHLALSDQRLGFGDIDDVFSNSKCMQNQVRFVAREFGLYELVKHCFQYTLI